MGGMGTRLMNFMADDNLHEAVLDPTTLNPFKATCLAWSTRLPTRQLRRLSKAVL